MTFAAGSTDLPHSRESRVDRAVRQFKKVRAVEAQREQFADELDRQVQNLSFEECAEYVRRTS